MHLIEIFVPLTDNNGMLFSQAKIDAVIETLTKQFGGVTAFTRSPAHDVTMKGGTEKHDEIIVIEVMAEELDRAVWGRFRKHLELEFAQAEILARATPTEKL